MLEIKNITRIIGMSCNGRDVAYAGLYDDGIKHREPHYVFRFNEIGDGKEYNSKKDIVLRRQPNDNGKYEMFCMGLQIATEIEIDYRVIKSPINLAERIRDVLITTQNWYKTT